MRNKSLFLLLACVCGTVAAIGVSQWMQANVGKGGGETVEIFVTSQAIAIQEELTADKVMLEAWPADKVPEGATNDFSKLEKRYAKQEFYSGEPVLLIKLMNDKDDVIVPKGFSVVSMKADQGGGTADLVRQGDRVDVSAYFNRNELIPRTTRQQILSGVRVFAIDGKTKRDKDEKKTRSARSISLLIRKADLEAWAFARKMGEIELSLASPGSNYENDENVHEASETANDFVTWLDDLRQAQEQARLDALDSGDVDPVTPNLQPAPKKNTWQVTKMVDGRMVVYEFTEGDTVPRIIADTGDPNGELEKAEEAPVISNGAADDLDYLNGQDSPLYQPRSGKDGSDNGSNYQRN